MAIQGEMSGEEEEIFRLVVDQAGCVVDQLIRFMTMCPYSDPAERVAALVGFMDHAGYSPDLMKVVAAIAVNRQSAVRVDG